ncbi:MAG: ion transporter [Actinomycetia bacterium]|nr:ion transporter [Actinomycetes bacterium]
MKRSSEEEWSSAGVSDRPPYQAAKARIHQILAITHPNDRASRVFGFFIIALIILNVIAVILQTVKWLNDNYGSAFYYFELASVVVFSVEYVLRLWSCTVEEKYARPIVGRLRYVVSPMALVDLAAIAPFYPLAFLGIRTADTAAIRALRLFRLMRLFKATRYSQSFYIMGRVLRAKKEQVLVAVLMVAILLVLLSSVMYFVERNIDHEGGEFSSIPAALWWGISTLSTVGYGDIYPVTIAGKIVGAIVALLGIGLFAMPAGILASGFAEELRTRHEHTKTCPHCGREIE